MKLVSQVVLLLIVSFGFGAFANAQLFKSRDIDGYTFRHITDRPGTDRLPRVSTNGLITWEGWESGTAKRPGDFEIFLSSVAEGAVVEQVTNNTLVDLRPVVNAHGDLAWTQRADINQPFGQELFVRSNGIVTQVTNDPADNLREERYPDINDQGIVVWASRTESVSWLLASYNMNSGDLNLFESIPAYRPHISNDNLIEFRGESIVDLLGNEVVDIPRSGFFDVNLHPAVPNRYRLYRRGEINHRNHVVIEADPGTSTGGVHPDFQGPRDILFWDSSTMRTVYRSEVWVGRADLNSSGIIAFEGLGGLPGSQSSPLDSEIFVYNANTDELLQLTDDNYHDQWATVLEDGSIVWQGTGNYSDTTTSLATDSDIFIAEPVAEPVATFALGDTNQDGFVNFGDISPFIAALSSPDYLLEADFNEDGVVDFEDISPFIIRLFS